MADNFKNDVTNAFRFIKDYCESVFYVEKCKKRPIYDECARYFKTAPLDWKCEDE